MARGKRERAPEVATHPSACHESRYPDDDLLRAHGYTIQARPKGGEALWRAPGGTVLAAREALRRLRVEE